MLMVGGWVGNGEVGLKRCKRETMNDANRKEVRCPSCKKLLGKVWGREFSLETVCPRCNIKVLFEVNPPALALAK